MFRGIFRTKTNIYDEDFFAKIVNSLQPWTISTKNSLTDVWLGSKYASGSLDTPCKMVPIKSFILQYLCHNQFSLLFLKKKTLLKKLHWKKKWFLVSQDLHWFINTTCITPLTFLIFNNVTKTREIANLYSSKSLLFIKHLQWE